MFLDEFLKLRDNSHWYKMTTGHLNLISCDRSLDSNIVSIGTNDFKNSEKSKSFCRFLKAEIIRFTCHAMSSVSCGSTMSLKMALKKRKLRKL